MAAQSQAIPAADLTARSADYPAVVGRNILEIAYGLGAANLVYNQTGTLAAGDSSASGFDRKYLVDRFRHTLWKGTAGTTHYLVIDQGASSLQWADVLIIEGHNWDSCTVTVESDSTTPADPWTGATAVWSSLSISGTTLVVNLQAANMYRERYWRIKIVKGSSFTPEAKQIWIGKAVQFPEGPLVSSDLPQSLFGDAIEIVTKGGVRTAYRAHGSLTARSAEFRIAQAVTGTFFTDLQDWFENSNALDGGIQPFWWIDDPTATPSGAEMVYLTDQRYRPRWNSPTVTTIGFEFREQGAG